MGDPRADSFTGGEFEIEKVPVFEQFHSIKSSWDDRGLAGGRYPSHTSPPHQAENKILEETVICHSKPASLSSTESSDGGSSRRIEHFVDFDQINNEKPRTTVYQTLNGSERRANTIVEPSLENHISFSILCTPSEHFKNINSQINSCVTNGLPVLESTMIPGGRVSAEEGLALKAIGIREVSVLYSDQHASSTDIVAEGASTLQHPIDLSQFFQEEHCNALEKNGCNGLTEVVADDVDSDSSHCDKVKPENEEDGEMLGGMFAFSDEG